MSLCGQSTYTTRLHMTKKNYRLPWGHSSIVARCHVPFLWPGAGRVAQQQKSSFRGNIDEPVRAKQNGMGQDTCAADYARPAVIQRTCQIDACGMRGNADYERALQYSKARILTLFALALK
jgi:hypothetical protein